MSDYQELTDLFLDKLLGEDWSDYHMYAAMFIVLVIIILMVRRKKR